MMVRCTSLWFCLLAGVSLLAGATPLPLSPVQEGSERSGEPPQVARGLTERVSTQADSLSGPAPAPAASTLPLAAPDGPSESIKSANWTGQATADSSSLQLGVSEAKLRGSGQRDESTAVIPREQHGGTEVTPASVKARLGIEGEASSAQTKGDDIPDVLRLNRTGFESQGPSQGKRADLKDAPVMDISGTLKTPSRAEKLEPVKAMKQGVSNITHSLFNPTLQPLRQELSSQVGMQMGLQVTGAMQVMGSEILKADLGGTPAEQLPLPDAQLLVRERSEIEETGLEAETAKTFLIKQPGPLNKSFLNTTDNGKVTESAFQRGTPLESVLSSEETRSRQTVAMGSIEQSTPSVSNTQESDVAPSHSTAFSHSYLVTSPNPGSSTTGGSPAWSEPHEAGHALTEPYQDGTQDMEQEVTASISAREALPRDSEVGKGSIPSSIGPDPETTLPFTVTAKVETGAMDGDEDLKSMALGQDSKALPTTEDIPLIFEPLGDAPSEAAVTAFPGGSQLVSQSSGTTSTHGALSRPELVSTVMAHGAPSLSEAPPPALSSGPLLPWQMSGTEMSDAVSPSVLPLLSAPPPNLPQDHGILNSKELDMTNTPAGTAEASPISFKTQQHKPTAPTPPRTAAMATSVPPPRHKSGLEQLESEEEHDDEDEEDEDTEESKEVESKEDMTEVTTVAPIRPTYSHIPYHFHSGPIWVQRNQGLVHNWAEKIRDKAGYVSGMLAPVGIGIAGALFILGALYSIKVMHRKRRNGYKRQRRKHREPSSRQDRVMLLADSSEDEF
ncbi:hypothetical protein AGOR_G00107280 [Albula goreensis]|uniref:Armadillo-like helical domain-containing protein 4 n=1 Tax=Albula goreensis TaxID=1534307 RepID=A0A8T3DKJ6_9TELE|nr:hypothetical protein AGOR_G00107280 [Albula goreensis]